ncbi:MAG: M3 family metallopeptidase [Dehalococcoidia bacterium]
MSGAIPFDFTTVTEADITPAIDRAIASCEAILAGIAAAPDGERTFANTLQPLDAVANLLERASGEYGFLSYVHPDAALRDTALEGEQRLETYRTSIGFREDLYRAVRAFSALPEAAALQGVPARFLDRTLRDFRRNGFALASEERARVQALQERLVTLGTTFRHNIDEHDDALLLAREQLRGLPDSYIERLVRLDTPEGPRFRVSLDYPELYPFLERAEDEALRRELFIKNHNKAAEVNAPLLAEAIAVRDEIATTLGYDSWAAYVIETKMAKTPEAVLAFLEDIEQRLQVKAATDIAEAEMSKRAEMGDPAARLHIWDWRYYQQRVQRERFEVDQFEVARYFPLDRTLDGMFELYQRLVGVRFIPVEEPRAWHPDVRLFHVEDAADAHHIGSFYVDLHPRPGKYGHAAAFTIHPGRLNEDGSYEPAVAAMVANFTKPGPDAPSLLRHSEVDTLFHEFGHILHQVLTRSPFVRFSGTSVEWDFVEAPSQMLEHWVWEPEVLRGFARHVETGEPISEMLIERMVAAKNVASGLQWLRQVYFARIDLAYHGPGRAKDLDGIAAELHPITAFDFVPGTHFQYGFGHLFGYDAGYYGYLWSRVYGDDMYTRFADGDPTAGADYRRVILEAGGTRDGMDLVRDFLGREPQNAAFLRDIGLEVGADGRG